MAAESGSAERALRWMGDLDHPFYNDERQRFIWYEASTIAFQFFLFANVAVAGLMFWVGGAQALPYGLAVFAVQAIAGIVAVNYANSKYVEYVPKPSELMSGRNLVYGALVLFAGSGLVRALLDIETTSDGSSSGSFIEGAAQGAIVGIISMPIVIGLVIFVKRRKADREIDDEF